MGADTGQLCCVPCAIQIPRGAWGLTENLPRIMWAGEGYLPKGGRSGQAHTLKVSTVVGTHGDPDPAGVCDQWGKDQ